MAIKPKKKTLKKKKSVKKVEVVQTTEAQQLREQYIREIHLQINQSASYHYLIMKEVENGILIAKATSFKVQKVYNADSMQPVTTLKDRKVCLIFVIRWGQVKESIFSELWGIGCPIYNLTSPWDVQSVFKEINE